MSNYQELAAKTLNGLQVRLGDDDLRIINFVLGMCGEAAELQRALAWGESFEKKVEEAGDCFWYSAAICTVMGVDFGEILAAQLTAVRFPSMPWLSFVKFMEWMLSRPWWGTLQSWKRGIPMGSRLKIHLIGLIKREDFGNVGKST